MAGSSDPRGLNEWEVAACQPQLPDARPRDQAGLGLCVPSWAEAHCGPTHWGEVRVGEVKL